MLIKSISLFDTKGPLRGACYNEPHEMTVDKSKDYVEVGDDRFYLSHPLTHVYARDADDVGTNYTVKWIGKSSPIR